MATKSAAFTKAQRTFGQFLDDVVENNTDTDVNQMDSNMLIASPVIAPLPSKSSERLIDQGLMHYEASVAGLAERYSRGETSHTIHVWWARRPHSAMRALVFATLCKDKSPKATNILQKIGNMPVVAPKVLEKARSLLNGHWYKTPPKLLDMFGGGGTIPLEAANLGAETYTGDVNALSVFIQKCNLQYSQNLKGVDIAHLLKISGTRVLSQLENETKTLYPLRKYNLLTPDKSSPFGYLWTYSTQCSQCKYQYYLSKRRWLSKKRAKGIAINVVEAENNQKIQLETIDKSNRLENAWVKRSGTVICPKCGQKSSEVNIKDCQDELIAIIKPAKGKRKEFFLATQNAMPSLDFIQNLEKTILAELEIELPYSKLPMWSGIVNPAIYGIETHADFLNPRQRVVLLLLLKALKNEYELLCTKWGKEQATYIISFLTGFIDQVVDWNCRLSMWIPQNEQVGRAFSGPGVAMLWDYVETDQILHGPANLWSKLDRIIKGASSIPHFPQAVTVKHGYAQKLDYPDNYFDAIVTDPPYYDNIYYSILADFIYAWKHPLLNLFGLTDDASPTTNITHELVASRHRSGSAARAHRDYCKQLNLAFNEIERVLKPDGLFSFVYSHSSLQGWEAVVKAYRTSNLLITSVQPLSIERRQRPRAMTSEAINTCIVFVARPGDEKRKRASLKEIEAQIKEKFIRFGHGLIQVGWKEKDAALSVFANGVGLLANVVCNDVEDLDILRAIASLIQVEFPSFSLKDRKSL